MIHYDNVLLYLFMKAHYITKRLFIPNYLKPETYRFYLTINYIDGPIINDLQGYRSLKIAESLVIVYKSTPPQSVVIGRACIAKPPNSRTVSPLDQSPRVSCIDPTSVIALHVYESATWRRTLAEYSIWTIRIHLRLLSLRNLLEPHIFILMNIYL